VAHGSTEQARCPAATDTKCSCVFAFLFEGSCRPQHVYARRSSARSPSPERYRVLAVRQTVRARELERVRFAVLVFAMSEGGNAATLEARLWHQGALSDSAQPRA
jgi:hypothetical protein